MKVVEFKSADMQDRETVMSRMEIGRQKLSRMILDVGSPVLQGDATFNLC
jgi:hypothetical protein